VPGLTKSPIGSALHLQRTSATVKDIRTILRLTHEHGLSVRAISDRLRISKTTIATYLLRARGRRVSHVITGTRSVRAVESKPQTGWYRLWKTAFREGGVHLIAAPIDYTENIRVLVDELRSAALDSQAERL
jgi:hypothetical protein